MAGRPILRRQDFKCISPYLYIKSNLRYLTKFAAPTIFQNKFCKPTHEYLINSPHPTTVYHHLRGRVLRKSIPTNSKKMQKTTAAFKNSMRRKLLEHETKIL